MAKLNWNKLKQEKKLSNNKPSYKKKRRKPSEKQLYWGRKYMRGFLAEKKVDIPKSISDAGLWRLCVEHGASGDDFNSVFSAVKSLGAKAL